MAFFCSSNPFQLLSGSVSLFFYIQRFPEFYGHFNQQIVPRSFLFLKPLPIIEWFCQSFSYIQRFPEFYGHFNQQIVPRPFFCSSNLFWLLSGSVSLFYLSNFFLNFMGILINRLCPGHFFVHQTPSNYRVVLSVCFSISNFFLHFLGILINRLCPGYYFVHQTVSNYWESPFPVRIFTNRWFCQFCFVYPTFSKFLWAF